MTTIEITDIADVQDGDIVTLRWKEEPGITVTLEGPAQDSTVGDYTITSGRFVSATREAPEWGPGTAGTATVRGVEGVRVMRTSGTGGADVMWLSASMVSGVRGHKGCDVTGFLPDDDATLRRSLEAAREGYLQAAADWRARDKRMGAAVDRMEAEADRLRALEVEEVWVSGPDAAPLPEAILTPDGAFYEDGVTPLEITDEMMRASGWKKQRRRVTPWEDA